MLMNDGVYRDAYLSQQQQQPHYSSLSQQQPYQQQQQPYHSMQQQQQQQQQQGGTTLVAASRAAAMGGAQVPGPIAMSAPALGQTQGAMFQMNAMMQQQQYQPPQQHRQQQPPQQQQQPLLYSSAPFVAPFGRQLSELDLAAGLQQLRLAARSDRGRRLATHGGFFRGAPWLLAPAIDAVQQSDLPTQWRQILELLEAMDAADGEDSTSESEVESLRVRAHGLAYTLSSGGGSVGDPSADFQYRDDDGTSDARSESVTPRSLHESDGDALSSSHAPHAFV